MQQRENECGVEIADELLAGTVEEKLDHILLNIQEHYVMVQTAFEEELSEKGRLMDKLYQELEEYRKDKSGQYIRSVLKDVIAVNRNVKRQVKSDRWKEKTAEELLQEIGYLTEDIDDLLERFDVEWYETRPGEPFDGKIHKVHGTVPVSDAGLDKTVAESVSCGYREGKLILYPEMVVVNTYKAEEAQREEQTTD